MGRAGRVRPRPSDPSGNRLGRPGASGGAQYREDSAEAGVATPTARVRIEPWTGMAAAVRRWTPAPRHRAGPAPCVGCKECNPPLGQCLTSGPGHERHPRPAGRRCGRRRRGRRPATRRDQRCGRPPPDRLGSDDPNPPTRYHPPGRKSAAPPWPAAEPGMRCRTRTAGRPWAWSRAGWPARPATNWIWGSPWPVDPRAAKGRRHR